jgi:hypothetical protein
MLDNNLIFSVAMSIIITLIFVAITYKDDFEKKKQEYLILFGITFISSFLMRTFMQNDVFKGDNTTPNLDILTKSSRPPF